jgi:hypothetical protein
MVHQRQNFLRLEILLAKFSSVDLWQTLVVAIRYAFAETDEYYLL